MGRKEAGPGATWAVGDMGGFVRERIVGISWYTRAGRVSAEKGAKKALPLLHALAHLGGQRCQNGVLHRPPHPGGSSLSLSRAVPEPLSDARVVLHALGPRLVSGSRCQKTASKHLWGYQTTGSPRSSTSDPFARCFDRPAVRARVLQHRAQRRSCGLRVGVLHHCTQFGVPLAVKGSSYALRLLAVKGSTSVLRLQARLCTANVCRGILLVALPHQVGARTLGAPNRTLSTARPPSPSAWA